MVMWWDCDTVYCGFWTNESRSAIFRVTLTLPSQWSFILVGFFTLFIALINGHLWCTITFVIHQINGSSKPQNDIHHQLQLTLRNTDSNATFISQLSQMIWVRRRSRSKIHRKSIGLVLFASLYGLLFAVAGGFSSRIIAARDPSALSSSRYCGYLQEPIIEDRKRPFLNGYYSYTSGQLFEWVNAVTVFSRNILRRSAAYSRSCYGRIGENSTACSNFVQPTLPYGTTRNLPCPFHERACNGAAISLDTGMLRSDTDLGINTSPEDALSVRKVLTCVPIAGEKYTDGWQQLPPKYADQLSVPFGTRYKGYLLGPRTSDSDSTELPFTTVIDEAHWKMSGQPYSLRWASAILDLPPNPHWNHFTPIADILNTSADTTIIGLTNTMSFSTAITDPWFRADNCTTTPGWLAPMTCSAVEPFSFLGCQEQYQFCIANSRHTSSEYCTPLTGLYKLFPDLFLAKEPHWNGTTIPNLNPTQKGLYYFLAKLMANSQLHWQLGFIGAENLVAREYLWDGGFDMDMSANLPPNQWEIEVFNWMNVSLASAQRGGVTYSRPSEYDVGGGKTILQYIEHPQDPALRSLCGKIKVRSSRHTSFSVFALITTVLIGLSCVLSSFVIRKIFRFLQCRTGHGLYKSQEWAETSTFQLQRMAAEGKGIGPWRGKGDNVPTLADPDLLFSLAEGRQYGNMERTKGEFANNRSGGGYRPLNKYVSYQEEELGGQGFVELRDLGAEDIYNA